MQEPINDGPSVFPSSLDASHDSDPGTAGNQLHVIAGDAAQTAPSLAGQVKQTLAGKLESQKGAASDMVEQFAHSVQRSGEQFQGRQDWIANAVGRGAEELNTLASSIRDKDIDELVGEVQSFAIRQPAVFVAAAFAAGFAVARVGKVIAGGVSRDDLPTIPEVGHGQH